MSGGRRSLKARLLAGSGILAGGQAGSQALALARNIALARLLSPEDFGIAAMLVMTVSMLEALSSLSVDRYLVQSDRGDDEALEAAAHSFMVLKGCITAVLLCAAAWPMSALFGVPGARWAFFCIAFVPLLRGLAHLDIKRYHRQFRFGPDMLVDLAGQAVALAVAIPFAWSLGNYAAMVFVLICQILASVSVSHLLAERPYRVAFRAEDMRAIWRFGWPLILNALLIFLTLNGDKFVIGAFYTPAELGVFAVAFSLAMMPATVLSRINATVFLPLLASRKHDPAAFSRAVRMTSGATTLAAVACCALLVFFGEIAVLFLYGSAYEGSGALLPWVAVMFAIRTMRDAASQTALALADTKNHLYANLVRNLAFVGMVGAAILQLPLFWFPAIAVIGELSAMVAAAVRLQRFHGVSMVGLLTFPAAGFALLVGMLLAVFWIDAYDDLLLRVLATVVACLAITGLLGVPLCRVAGFTLRRSAHIVEGIPCGPLPK